MKIFSKKLNNYTLLGGKCSFSTNNVFHTMPVKTYTNLDDYNNKLNLYHENNNKSGIYMLTNIINNKYYVGSSVNLTRRFKEYLSHYFLSKQLIRGKSIIYKAIQKYSFSNFKIEILEYCEPKDCIRLEQYYMDKLKPEYNLCINAGSMLGFKHSESTILKMRKPKSLDHINKLKIIKQELHNKKDSPYKLDEYRNKLSIKSAKAIPVSVLNTKTNVLYKFSSASKAALYIGCHKDSVSSILRTNSNRLLRKVFLVKKLKN